MIERDDTRVNFCGMEVGYSRSVRAGDFIFLSGHTAVDSGGHVGLGDIRQQTELTFEKLKVSLERLGCGLSDVVKITAFLADPRDFLVMNQVFNEVFGDTRPARTTVTATPVLATKLELDIVVYKPAASGQPGR